MNKKYNIIYHILVCIIIILTIFAGMRYKNASKSSNILDSFQFTTIVEIYEIENPNFNWDKTCRTIIEEEYPNRKCAFDWGERQDLPLGSKTQCVIKCE